MDRHHKQEEEDSKVSVERGEMVERNGKVRVPLRAREGREQGYVM